MLQGHAVYPADVVAHGAFCGRGQLCCRHQSCHVLRTSAGWNLHPAGVEVLPGYMLWKLPLTEVNEPLMEIANALLMDTAAGSC
ncbi:hypothetical protein Nepgr_021691 [Nepenthes gracilis]|uniref:Uncharacterized protein n=1 Tax=Nepenthes gracilis TaxID=150966 RepID=A0AAD3SXX6_NEPGR|nr:hypothetical protein Nepgr_021691 [Nepenthes gracilis]